MSKETNLAHISDALEAKVGDWYWLRLKDGKRKFKRFTCIVHVGSNYYELKSPDGKTCRIHVDKFFRACEPVKNPDRIIRKRIDKYKFRVQELMAEVQEITRRLGVAPHEQLGEESPETQALATISEGSSFSDYSQALVKAKDEDLPGLFEKIRAAHEDLATWMKANIIPLQAQTGGIDSHIERIEDRIFSVELYAGLTEKVIRVADGEPAAMGDRLHLMQRRLYMDEECLAHYRVGGMDFDNLAEFDAWLAEPENRDRILPFPRSMVSFRVRRHTKKRRAINIQNFFSNMAMEDADKSTYLYVRNGEQIFCICSDLNFGKKLFPDFDKQMLGEPMMANMEWGTVDELITRRAYEEVKKNYAKNVQKWKEEMKVKDDDPDHTPGPWDWPPRDVTSDYEPFNDSSVYYDDMAKKMAKDIRHYNRIALVIQGIFDRSPILHPHPPVKTWTQEGFDSAVELIYDQDRALYPDEKPDFKAYRKGLAEQIEEGSWVIGQRGIWARKEAEKENGRRSRSWHYKAEECDLEHHYPYGNPGPNYIARIDKLTPRSRKVTFEWMRKRQERHPIYGRDEIETKIQIPVDKLFNVSAYKPGDFRQFLGDPRTQAEYLKWAPFLIAAEEFHAGNIDLETGRKKKKKRKKKRSKKKTKKQSKKK